MSSDFQQHFVIAMNNLSVREMKQYNCLYWGVIHSVNSPSFCLGSFRLVYSTRCRLQPESNTNGHVCHKFKFVYDIHKLEGSIYKRREGYNVPILFQKVKASLILRKTKIAYQPTINTKTHSKRVNKMNITGSRSDSMWDKRCCYNSAFFVQYIVSGGCISLQYNNKKNVMISAMRKKYDQETIVCHGYVQRGDEASFRYINKMKTT